MHDDADFRSALYERYVSTGKRPSGEPSYAWWDHKYLPLLAGLDRAAPILEIGCGDGGLLAYLARRGFSHAAGIDISPEQVELARRRGVRAEVADVFESLAGCQGGTVAAIVAVDVFEHFSRDELMRLAPLLHAALQPGGRLLVQTANGAGLFPAQVIYGDLTHMTIFTPRSLAQLLRASGFVDFAFYETGPIPIRVRGKVDVALWSAIKAFVGAIRRIETGKRQAIWTENFICVARKLPQASHLTPPAPLSSRGEGGGSPGLSIPGEAT
ncbi:MAG TPA: class I SAM-dependent methyltransferase [Chloroflexota bacterium]|nr:class I SAM-dependent methyltransferase [Chloroflexota bacterium]